MVERIQQLTTAMAAGDAVAVEAFYREYFSWMYSQARRATKRDESFCLDVVQDAVLRVIRTVKPVDSERRFRSWLGLVVQTTAFDLLRKEKRRRNREAMAGVSPVEVDTDSLQLDWLAEQISSLDAELVKIIELRFEQRWTLRRIGETLGLSVGAVDGRLRLALQNIRLNAEDEKSAQAITPAVLISEPSIELVGPVLSQLAGIDDEHVEAQPTGVDRDEAGLTKETPSVPLGSQSGFAGDEPAVTLLANAAHSVEASVDSAEAMIVAVDAVLEFGEVVSGAAAAVLVSETGLAEAKSVAVEILVASKETVEIVSIEDEAGAYDDAI